VLTYIVAFFLSLTVALVLTPIVRWFAHRFGFVDIPNEERKIHTTPVPRIGGIAIAVAFFVPVFGLYFLDNSVSEAYLTNQNRVIGLMGGSIFIIGLGLWDDIRGLRARTKFVLEVVLAIGVFYLDYRIDTISHPFGPNLELGFLALPVTVLWIVGIINAINLLDGLDGLAGGVSLINVLTLFVVSLVMVNTLVGLTSIAMAGALIGFLRYNFNPASIFMGDSGSLFIGFVLAVTAISGASRYSTVVSLLIPILALSLPILDTTISVGRRFVAGRPLFAADRGHVHHKLLELGLSHRQVVLALYAFCLMTGIGALTIIYADSRQVAIILGAIGAIVIVFSKVLGYFNWKTVSASVQYGLMRQQRLRGTLKHLELAAKAVDQADDLETLYAVLRQMAVQVDLDVLEMVATVEGVGEPVEMEFYWSKEGEEKSSRQTMHQIGHGLQWHLGEISISGRLAFTWYCMEEMLQIPERVCYELIATKTRDRLLHLSMPKPSQATGS